jgi:hypothetical protein
MKEYSKAIMEVIRRKRSNVRKYGLKRIPFDIILLMLEEQERQTGKVNVETFQRFLASSSLNGGFDWEKSPQGYMWWYNTLRKHAPYMCRWGF